MTPRCPTCDRVECPWIPYAAMNCDAFDAVDANLTFAASQDCRANSDWRGRAIAAEAERDAAIREADRDHWRRTELAPRLAKAMRDGFALAESHAWITEHDGWSRTVAVIYWDEARRKLEESIAAVALVDPEAA